MPAAPTSSRDCCRPLPADAPEVVPGALAGALFDATPRAKGQGSNAWVVAGSRTASGAPLLANDPHLLAMQPGIWLECHLSAPGIPGAGRRAHVLARRAAGVHRPSRVGRHERERRRAGPVRRACGRGPLAGRARRRGGAAHRAPGGDRRARRRRASRARRAARRATVRCSTRSCRARCTPSTCGCRPSRRTPCRGSGSSTASGPRSCSTWRRRSRSRAFREAALDGLACPGQNVVYADVDGTIGYACTGRYPVRASGDGTVPVPGWTDDHEWVGWVPPEELPWGVDPGRGFLVTANHRMHDEGYPHLIGHDFHTPWRARRIAQVLASRDGHDVAGMAALQVDVVSLSARENVPLLLERVEAGDGGGSARGARAAGVVGRRDDRRLRRHRDLPDVVRAHRPAVAGAAARRGGVRALPRVARAVPVRGAGRTAARRGARTPTCSARRSTRRWPSCASGSATTPRRGAGATCTGSCWRIRWRRSRGSRSCSWRWKPAWAATTRP